MPTIFNCLPGREQVQVLYDPSLLVCSQHCRAILKPSRVMRTHEKKKTSKRPEVRSLKIQLQIRLNRWSSTKVPEIRLRGNWLGKLGFTPEQRVNITTMNKLLIIQVEE